MRVEIVPATTSHAINMAVRMRQLDRQAIIGMGYDSIPSALFWSLKESVEAWAVLRDGEVQAMGGVTRWETPQAWFASADGCKAVAKSMWKAARDVLRHFDGRRVDAVVYGRDLAARRWLTRLGFSRWNPIVSPITSETFLVGRRV